MKWIKTFLKEADSHYFLNSAVWFVLGWTTLMILHIGIMAYFALPWWAFLLGLIGYVGAVYLIARFWSYVFRFLFPK